MSAAGGVRRLTAHLGPHRVVGLLGLACAALAFAAGATPGGAVAGALAALAACTGAGAALTTLGNAPRRLAADAALGLAALVVAATLLAQLGLFSRQVQLGLGALGLAGCALPGRAAAPRPSLLAASLVASVVAAATLLLVGLEAFDLAPVISDLTNHAVALARFWQTSDAAALRHQLGGQLAGESMFAFVGGLPSAGLFDAGAAPALLVALLAEVLLARRPDAPDAPDGADLSGRRWALLAFLALPIIFHPDIRAAPTARWSTTLLHIAGLLRLRELVSGAVPRRLGTVLPVFVLAAALIALRVEASLLALSLVIAALWLPAPSTAPAAPLIGARRHAVLGAVVLLVIAAQLIVRPSAVSALTVVAAFAGGLAVAAFLTTVLLRLVGFAPWRDELSAACAGATATSLVGVSGLAGSIQAVLFAAWFGLLVLAFLRSFAPDAAGAAAGELAPADLPALRGPVGVVLAISAGILVLGPNLSPGRRERLLDRVSRTLGAAPELRALGLGSLGRSGLAELQAHVPAGARLGFWGSHPGGLDFRKNPIIDLSWPRSGASAATYLAPLSRASLSGVDFVLVENVKKWVTGGIDPWGSTETGATALVEDVLELFAEAPSARLYRVHEK